MIRRNSMILFFIATRKLFRFANYLCKHYFSAFRQSWLSITGAPAVVWRRINTISVVTSQKKKFTRQVQSVALSLAIVHVCKMFTWMSYVNHVDLSTCMMWLVMQVCATLGTTAVCSYDNLEEIGLVCKRGSGQGCAFWGSRWWPITFKGSDPQKSKFWGVNRHFKPNLQKIQIAISSKLCIGFS